MLKKKRQQKYLIKRWLEIRRQLYAFSGSGNHDALHKLRVEIKKIRAFVKLYKGKIATTGQLKAVRKIFHRAGIIREANINLQMMKRLHIEQPVFNAEEKHAIQRESERFHLHPDRYEKHIRNNIRSLLKVIRPIRNRSIKHWFSRQLKAIAGIVAASSTDQFHLARKKIKRLIYIYGMLHKRLTHTLKINIAYLDQLQDAIGEWHDTTVAAELLTDRNTGNKTALKRLRNEQDRAGVAIHTLGDDFLGKVHELRL